MIETAKSRSLPYLLIVLAAFAVYWPALRAPVILDDAAILDEISKGNLWQYLAAVASLKARSLAALSFKLGYEIHGGFLFGYRVVNVAIHCVNGFLVYGIAKRFAGRESVWPAIIGALIFTVHPIQVQAVSYIAQRFVLLSAMFYLLVLCEFISIREGRVKTARGAVIMLVFSLCAVLSKEIAVTLPLAIFLADWILPSEGRIAFRQSLAIYVPLCFVSAIPVILRLLPGVNAAPWLFTRAGFDDNAGVAYAVYALTELNVLAQYIRLIIWPSGLHFIHDVVAARSFFQADVAASTALHLSLISLALLLRKRQPLVSFGILFFYTAHLVESFTVPLIFSMFEYRSYLSMAGVSMIISGLANRAFCLSLSVERALAGVFCALCILLFSAGAFFQNVIYANPVVLWERSVALSPKQPLSHAWLGISYMNAGLYEYAVWQFLIAKQSGIAGMDERIGAAMRAIERARATASGATPPR